MGIYNTRGLEYRIELVDTYKIVIPMRELEDRLVKMSYYLQQKDTWFSILSKQTILNQDQTLDLKFTADEKERIYSELQKYGSDVKHHGIYDVATYWSTL